MKDNPRKLKSVLRADFLWFSCILISICGVLVTSFYYFNVSGRLDHEREWLESYSQSFLKDLQLGDVATVEAKLKRFAKRHGFIRVEIKFGNNRIEAIGKETGIDSNTLAQGLADLFSATSAVSVDLKDPVGTLFGKMTIDYDPLEFYRTSAASFLVIFVTLISLLLIIIGLYIKRLADIDRPFLQLIHSIRLMRVQTEGPTASIKNRIEAAIKLTGIVEMDLLLEEFSQSLTETVFLQDQVNKSKVTAAIAATTSALAHDVRKPFSMLKMVLNSILNAQTPLEAQEIAKGSLPEIAQSLITVDGMIQDVMQIGSNSKPNQESTVPDTIIENTLNEVFRIFPDAIVSIDYDLKHKHSIFVDTLRVARVFSNIICNALQAMDAKGLIWIKTAELEGFLEFRLGNAGSCIPETNLPKLFEAFFTSDKKGGTGLGLAIAQKVVNEHGGSIRCESERNSKYPDGYVEFIFTLPLTAELCEARTQPLPKTASEVHAQFASMKPKNLEAASAEEIALEIQLSQKIEVMGAALPSLLIVDDEAVYRNSLANLLHQGNLPFGRIPVLFAKNYDEALGLCKTHNPLLVIQDIDLGASSKNGIETIVELRRLAFKGRICVHSNRFLFGDQKKAFDAGADSVMPKPMSRMHLLKIIMQALTELDTVASFQTPPKLDVTIAAKPHQIKLAFLDDTKTFTMIWKMNLKNLVTIETFSKTTQFLERAECEPDFLLSFDLIVTDYHFADGDPHTGKTFAAELRKLGFLKPIMLATNGDFSDDELKPDLNGCVGKEVPSLEQIESWMQL